MAEYSGWRISIQVSGIKLNPIVKSQTFRLLQKSLNYSQLIVSDQHLLQLVQSTIAE